MPKTFCTKCGSEIGDAAAFCIFCGTPIDEPRRSAQAETGLDGVASASQWDSAANQAFSQTAPHAPSRSINVTQSMPQAHASVQAKQKASKAPRSIIIGACVAAIVIAVVVALFLLVPMLGGGTNAAKIPVSVGSRSSTSTTSSTGATPPVFTEVTVSSELPGDADTAYYGPNNLVDGNSETAWNEGASGAGVGEWAKFSASSLQHVTSVSIMGGFPKYYKDGSDVYQKNPRPKEITVSYEGGSQSFTMQDLRGEFQTFTFTKPVDTKWITITIDSVYTGRKYEDCCIAEVKFQ